MCRDPGNGSAALQGLAAALAGCVVLGGGPAAAQQVPRFGERVSVARVIVDARVLDDWGNPVQGLSADDFRVRIDGQPAKVESATWVGASDEAGPDPARASLPAGPAFEPGTGRLIVFLFQKDLEPSRIVGLMRMLARSRNLLATLGPADRIAILSFDSHLEIWSDFTSDRARLDRVLAHGLLLDAPPAVQTSGVPSLLERLDRGAARHTYGIERALELIANALGPLPGSKSLVLVGHGFGRLTLGGVVMANEYGPARAALVGARTSVFSLDVTDADYHSLEAGLQVVAEDTGGFYTRTNVFPGQAIARLSGALAGYYVLFVEQPESRRDTHDVRVTLARHKGQVLAPAALAFGPAAWPN